MALILTQGVSLDALHKHPLLYNYHATGQATSIAATNLIPVAPAGFYRIAGYVRTSSAGTGNVTTTIAFTDNNGAKTLDIPAVLTLNAGAFSTASTPFWVASGAVSFSTVYQATGSYDITLCLERLL